MDIVSPMKNNKILIMAGGTGGHIFPALSIAEYLIEKGLEVEWLGTTNSMEEKIIGDTEIPLHFISISGLRGKGLWKKIISPILILVAVVQSIFKLLTIKPACVLGMGGFVSGPAGFATWLLGKKLLIHEQNAIAGFSNQMLSPLAETVMEAFPGAYECKKRLGKNSLIKAVTNIDHAIVVGNPIRKEIINCKDIVKETIDDKRKLRILVIGGSLGAVAINNVIPELLVMFNKEEQPEVIHQCGKNNVEQTQKKYAENGLLNEGNVRVQAFISDMAISYQWADLIICRSGAITVSEIACVGIPAILIPYPYAVDDHQTENAKVLANENAAWLIPQNKLTAKKIYKHVNYLMKNRNQIVLMGMAAKKVSCETATENVSKLCLEACYA